jgi:hypothetical protein
MTDTTKKRPRRRGPGTVALACAAGMSAAAALLAGCSNSGTATATGLGSGAAHGSAPGGQAEGSVPAPGRPASGSRQPAARTTGLVSAQSIIYTASLTVQASNVPAAAQRAAGIVAGAGGYTAGEQESSLPGRRQVTTASLQLKIPVAGYPATLSRLSTQLGTRTSLSQQARDVTQQVTDVASRVASAQAAIAQLRALLKRAGSVGDLLAVQDQINSQESDLEALQAQQRALAHQTTYATVSLLLLSHHQAIVKKKTKHGFVAGLAAGWRGLRRATTWLLTVIGSALPFAVILALAGGIGYVGWKRVSRRRPPPTTAD